MTRLNEHHLSYVSGKTFTRSENLVSRSDISLGLSNGAGLELKKQNGDGQMDQNDMGELLIDSFVAKPCAADSSAKLRTLWPLMLIPRSCLPLSYIDICSSAKKVAQSRLWEAHIKVLELEERIGSQPMVLIAEESHIIYAAERESRGLYMLCQIGSWVKLRDLKASAVASRPESANISQQTSTLRLNAPATPKIGSISKKKRLAIEAIQSMVKRPCTALGSVPRPPSMETESEISLNGTLAEKLHENASSVRCTSAEIFENVRTQYFESLYLSKASLAYFAKGPLSRARAAFSFGCNPTLELNDYIAFLENLIMSTTLIDKKYREGVPNCVALFDTQDNSVDDSCEANEQSRKKRMSMKRVSKKIKPRKNGIYPCEESLIKRWWAAHNDDAESGLPGSTKEEVTKTRTSQLRVRETQLQIILILEILALQPLASTTEGSNECLPATLPSMEPDLRKEKLKKCKKLVKLDTLIDVYVDRLCIWQSVAMEPLRGIGESQIVVEKRDETRLTRDDSGLQEFCIEVITPFFSSRLPDRCSVINRKLGGPVLVSALKPMSSKAMHFPGALSRPGAVTKRALPVNPRRSLKRVLTDEQDRRSASRGPNKSLSLMKSATAPMVLGTKREASEAPSMSGISAAEPLEANRGGVLTSKRFARREVDFSTMGCEVNSKLKQKISIEAELKAAISLLKRPNREQVGKEFAEIAEKRSASASHSRKSNNPICNPFFPGVQISATPKTNRSRDVSADSKKLCTESRAEGFSSVLSSNSPIITKSVSRSGNSLSNNPLFSLVQATPPRKSIPSFSQRIQISPNIGNNNFPPSSPLSLHQPNGELDISLPDSTAARSWEMDNLTRRLQETPVKKRIEKKPSHEHNSFVSIRGNDIDRPPLDTIDANNENDIYKALGWDDTVRELA